MRRINVTRLAAWTLMSVCIAGMAKSASGEVMTFGAAKDTTLFESTAGTNSAGGDEGIFVGRTGQTTLALRRGLIEFDLSALPAGATINSVSLRLFTTMSSGGGPANTAVTLHRVLGDWGEGNVNPSSTGGTDGIAQTGDATWRYQFFASDQWTSLGGDFVAQASASANVGGGSSNVNWASTPALVTDVQSWLTDSNTNFGWLLRGNETVSRSARKFASSEFLTPNNRPLLTIDFTPPPARTPGDINNDGFVNAADVALLASFYGETTTANNFNLGEFSGDGLVGLADMAILQRNLSPLGLGSPAAVPEPAGATLICCGVCVAAIWSMRRMKVLACR